MKFEFDEKKSLANKEKHGLDFFEAQALWYDPDVLEIPAKITDEPRFLIIGRIWEKYWSAVVTYRKDTIRIISVRRASVEEVVLYES